MSVGLTLNPEKYSVILLDVAGTTTDIHFVEETLFPYAKEHAEKYLKGHWEDAEVKTALKDLNNDKELNESEALETFNKLAAENSSKSGLKTLQGLIYKEGYENGDLKGHIYPDVRGALESWSKFAKIAIYSTGSVESQKLLFLNTTEGDVSAQINKYFDQNVGAKTDSKSYEKIASEFEVKPDEIIFLTDNLEEAQASKTAGILTVLVTRDVNAELSEDAKKDFFHITSFENISFENSGKRKNEEGTEEPPSKLPKVQISEEAISPADVKTPEDLPELESMEVDSAKSQTADPIKLAKLLESSVDEPEKKTKEESIPEAAPTEKAAEKPVPTEEKTEETKLEEVATTEVVSDDKTEKTADETDISKPVVSSSEPKTEEEVVVDVGDAEKPEIVKEKENDSDLANGVDETTAKDKEEVNGNVDGEKEKEKVSEEIAVKKVEESEEKAAVVGVEV